jgi:hypothetical protein
MSNSESHSCALSPVHLLPFQPALLYLPSLISHSPPTHPSQAGPCDPPGPGLESALSAHDEAPMWIAPLVNVATIPPTLTGETT